jgi:hypothetical protein
VTLFDALEVVGGQVGGLVKEGAVVGHAGGPR